MEGSEITPANDDHDPTFADPAPASSKIGWLSVIVAITTVGLTIGALYINSTLGVLLMIEAAVFIPVERALAIHPKAIFRRGWKADIVHIFMDATLVKAALGLVVAGGYALFHWLVPSEIPRIIREQPGLIQFAEALLLSELLHYFAHRFTHSNRIMWKFHALHHSIEEMDWLSAGRLHPIDQVFTQACIFIPLAVLFPKSTLAAYLVLAGFQAFFIHSNIRCNFGPLRYVFATPEFHHWHHANQREAYNSNFSQQFPWLDALFGTLHMPKNQYPEAYGVNKQAPEGYLAQLGWSFTYSPWRKQKKRDRHGATNKRP